MGVQGLWQVLAPAGRRVDIATLQGKTLAIDVSIWLIQFIRGMRNETDNSMVHNAHLLGSLRRILRLLANKIKPVFVFDGGVSVLKRKTIEKRRHRQEIQEQKIKSAARKIFLSKLLLHKNSSQAKAVSKQSNIASNFTLPKGQKKSNDSKPKLEKLPEAKSNKCTTLPENQLDNLIYDLISDSSIDKEKLEELGPDVQFQVLQRLKDRLAAGATLQLIKEERNGRFLRESYYNKLLSVPKQKRSTMREYSDKQLNSFLKQTKTKHEISGIQKELNSNLRTGSKKRRVLSEKQKYFVLNETKASHIKEVVVEPKRNSKENAILPLKPLKNLSDINKKSSVHDKTKTNCFTGSEMLQSFTPSFEKRESTEVTEKSVETKQFATVELVSSEEDSSSGESDIEWEDEDSDSTCTPNLNVRKNDKVISGPEQVISSKHMTTLSQQSQQDNGKNVQTLVNAKNKVQISNEKSSSRPLNYNVDKVLLSKDSCISGNQSKLINQNDLSSEAESIKTTDGKILSNVVTEKSSINNNDNKYNNSKNRNSVALKPSDDLTSSIIDDKDDSIMKIDDAITATEHLSEKEKHFRQQVNLSTEQYENLKKQISTSTKEMNAGIKNTEEITDLMLVEIKQMLKLFGLPYIEAPMEAEAQCAELYLKGLVDGVVTDDSDAFVFGAGVVYKNIFSDRKFVEAYTSKEIKRVLGLQREQLICMALMLGSDYTEGVKHIGIVNSLEIIQHYSTYQQLKMFQTWVNMDTTDNKSDSPALKEFKRKHAKAKKKWIIPESFPSKMIIAAYEQPTVLNSDNLTQILNFKPAARNELESFLTKKLGFLQEKLSQLLDEPLRKWSERKRQTLLDSYLTKYEDSERFATIRSKRMKKALTRILNNK